MRISVRIETVVLDGLELSGGERAALGPAIARELRLLAGEPAGRRAETPGGAPGSAVDAIAREVAVAAHRATQAAHRATQAARPATQAARPAARGGPG